LSRCPGVDKLIGAGDALPAFAFFAPLLSLPCLLQTSLQTIPAKVPYIFADPKLVEKWSRRLASVKGFKVGICWQGSPKYRLDRQRSIPLHHFAPLAEVPGVTLISLQKGFGTEQISDIRDRVPVLDWGSELDSATGAFEDTAAVMMGLDFVVTSDTAIAHLAGALGVPVWVALAAVPEWRWHLDREDCPWYPTMRLFRQPAAGDWQSPFARIADELQSQIDRRLAERTGLWQKAGRQISRLFRGSS
jgi:hypothetical protein